jgi:hypothetical protein
VYGRAVLWTKVFSVGNTELHIVCNTEENVDLFLHSGEVFPGTGYLQRTDGKRFF